MKKEYMLRRFLPVPVFVVLLAMIALTVPSQAGVLPAQANPRGTSIDDMTGALGKFQDTFDLSFFPNTRFQILFAQNFNTSVNGMFTVSPGTFFFVPIFSFNDSPPVIEPFPTNSSQVRSYIFGPLIGAHDIEIEVDGQVTQLGPPYLSSLVYTPNLPHGGSHTILLGAFHTPLPKGTHTVMIRAAFNGTAIGSFDFELLYLVIVQ